MTEFQKGLWEGVGFAAALVVIIGPILALCGGAIGLMIVAWRWVATLMSGGCQ